MDVHNFQFTNIFHQNARLYTIKYQSGVKNGWRVNFTNITTKGRSVLRHEGRVFMGIITNSPDGFKMLIPVSGNRIPAYFKEMVSETVAKLAKQFSVDQGYLLEAKDIYVEAYLTVFLEKRIPVDRKYSVLICNDCN